MQCNAMQWANQNIIPSHNSIRQTLQSKNYKYIKIIVLKRTYSGKHFFENSLFLIKILMGIYRGKSSYCKNSCQFETNNFVKTPAATSVFVSRRVQCQDFTALPWPANILKLWPQNLHKETQTWQLTKSKPQREQDQGSLAASEI